MSTASSSVNPVPENGGPPDHQSPPSLRRQAPAVLTLVDESSQRPPPIGRAGLYLRSRRRYRLLLQTWPADLYGQVEHVSVDGGECLRVIVPVGYAPGSRGGREYTACIRAKGAWGIPFPVCCVLAIDLRHERWGLFTLPVPVIVWPSFLMQLCWVMGMVCSLAGSRFLRLWEDKERRVVDVLIELGGDGIFLFEVVALSLGLLILLWLAGHLYVALASLLTLDRLSTRPICLSTAPGRGRTRGGPGL